MVEILAEGERIGGILGILEKAGEGQAEEEEEPVRGNYYLVTSRDYGGIDGISYNGAAQPVEMDEFFAMEGVPEDFQWAKLTFIRGDGTRSVRRIRVGATLAQKDIPSLSEKEEAVGIWPGVGEQGMENIFFDRVIQMEYIADLSAVESEEYREGKTLMLLEGVFPPDFHLELTQPETVVELDQERTLLESRAFAVPDQADLTRGRYLIPENQDPERLEVYVRDALGTWRKVPFTVEKSYLVFPMETGDNAAAVALLPEKELKPAYLAAGIAGAVVVIGLSLWGIRGKRKASRAKKTETDESVQT